MDYTVWIATSADGSHLLFDHPPDRIGVKNLCTAMERPISVVRAQCVTVSEVELFTVEKESEMDSERFAALVEDGYGGYEGHTLVLHLSRFLNPRQREDFLDFIGVEY